MQIVKVRNFIRLCVLSVLGAGSFINMICPKVPVYHLLQNRIRPILKVFILVMKVIAPLAQLSSAMTLQEDCMLIPI